VKADLLADDDPRWTAFLEAVEHDFYHVPGYVALSAEHEGGRAHALLVERDGASMLLPLIIRPISMSAQDATSPYGYPGPLLRGATDAAFVRDAFRAGIERLAGEQIVSAFVRFHPFIGGAPPNGIGTVVTHGETVSIDLTLSTDALWRQTRENFRRDIAKSLKAGYVAHKDEAWDHLGTFGRLYRETMTRRSARASLIYDDRYFERFRSAVGSAVSLHLVEIDGVVAAAGLFVETGEIVQYHLAGWDQRFAEYRPMKLLIHGAAAWAKARGARRLHLGGGVGAASDSLLHFKAGFSPERHRFSTMRAVLDEPAYERLVAARDPHLDPASRDGFFPLYRTS
jgi:CelD/BcsL family acetyltransferase involved in cellulose biosynthesis